MISLSRPILGIARASTCCSTVLPGEQHKADVVTAEAEGVFSISRSEPVQQVDGLLAGDSQLHFEVGDLIDAPRQRSLPQGLQSRIASTAPAAPRRWPTGLGRKPGCDRRQRPGCGAAPASARSPRLVPVAWAWTAQSRGSTPPAAEHPRSPGWPGCPGVLAPRCDGRRCCCRRPVATPVQYHWGVLFPHHRQHAGPFGQHKTVPVFAVGPGRLIRGVVAAGQGPHGGKAHKPQSVSGASVPPADPLAHR